MQLRRIRISTLPVIQQLCNPCLLQAIWCLPGNGSLFNRIPAGWLLKRSAHEGDRPAIFAAQFTLSHACWLAAYALAGWIGSIFGLTVAVALVAAVAKAMIHDTL